MSDNTADTTRALEDIIKHERERITTELLSNPFNAKYIQEHNKRGNLVYICPVGFNSESYHPYNSHHKLFMITPEELADAQGLILCELCETECIEIKGA